MIDIRRMDEEYVDLSGADIDFIKELAKKNSKRGTFLKALCGKTMASIVVSNGAISEAQRLKSEVREELAKKGYTVVWDGVGDHPLHTWKTQKIYVREKDYGGHTYENRKI